MRISDWSSDVCSSDLSLLQHREWVVRLFLRIGGGLRLLLTRQQPALFGKRIVRQPRIGIQRKADRHGGKFPDIARTHLHRKDAAILLPQFTPLLPRHRKTAVDGKWMSAAVDPGGRCNIQ